MGSIRLSYLITRLQNCTKCFITWQFAYIKDPNSPQLWCNHGDPVSFFNAGASSLYQIWVLLLIFILNSNRQLVVGVAVYAIGITTQQKHTFSYGCLFMFYTVHSCKVLNLMHARRCVSCHEVPCNQPGQVARLVSPRVTCKPFTASYPLLIWSVLCYFWIWHINLVFWPPLYMSAHLWCIRVLHTTYFCLPLCHVLVLMAHLVMVSMSRHPLNSHSRHAVAIRVPHLMSW